MQQQSRTSLELSLENRNLLDDLLESDCISEMSYSRLLKRIEAGVSISLQQEIRDALLSMKNFLLAESKVH